MSFTKRKITLKFQLGQGAMTKGGFGANGEDVLTVSGLRVQCKIVKYGAPDMSMAELRIYGLSLSVMNKLTALNPTAQMARNNTITVMAGDDENGMTTAFIGQIIFAQLDMNQQPDAALSIIAKTGFIQAVMQTDSTSFPGQHSAIALLRDLATRGRLDFEQNDAPDIQLSKAIYVGSVRDQIMTVTNAISDRIGWVIDDTTLAVWKRGSTRSGSPVVISPSTGMIGYPSFSNIGISVRTLYNPALRFMCKVKVEGSQIEIANGNWIAWSLVHDLDSETPGGNWQSSFNGQPQDMSAYIT